MVAEAPPRHSTWETTSPALPTTSRMRVNVAAYGCTRNVETRKRYETSHANLLWYLKHLSSNLTGSIIITGTDAEAA